MRPGNSATFSRSLPCIPTNVIVTHHRCRMSFTMRPKSLTDKSLIALYESLRKQTTIDANGAGLRSRVIGQNTKDYAEKLRAEMERRQLLFTPIEWSTSQ